MTRTVRITGGPAPSDIKIVDKTTGADLTSLFLSFRVEADGKGMTRVFLECFAEMDLEAEIAEAKVVDAEIVG